MTSDEEDLQEHTDLFREPDDYYQSEKPATFVNYPLQAGHQLHLRLVGHNPLWGHLLWNAGRVIADYLDTNADILIKNKDVLELGAGAGLPSLVSAVRGARQVVVTDYPDPDLIQNLQYNIDHCDLISSPPNIAAEGYLWGNSTEGLVSYLTEPEAGFDLLILADVVFNHSEHQKLIQTINATLKRTFEAQALVFFTPYRPWLLDKDLAFFTLAEKSGFLVEMIMEKFWDTDLEEVRFREDSALNIHKRKEGYTVSVSTLLQNRWEQAS